MNTNDLFGYALAAAVGILIWSLILSSIIKGANQTAKRDKIQLENQKILALIAEKLGVDPEQIQNIINPKFKL